jgi:hypothetical protein
MGAASLIAAACGGALELDGGSNGGTSAVPAGGSEDHPGMASGPQGGSSVVASGGAAMGPGEELVAVSSDQVSQIWDTACAGTAFECEINSYRVELVVDLSATMGQVAPGSTRTSWELVRDGLRAAIAKPLPFNAREAGILFFPNRATTPNLGAELPASACINSTDDVAIAPPDSSSSAMDGALARVEPSPDAGAPIHDAYRMAIDALSQMGDDSLLTPLVVLVTDGHPTFELGCYGTGLDPVDPEPVIAEITNARQAGIQTLVVGAPGSADARSWLSRAARAGSWTDPACSDEGPVFCHIDMIEHTDLALALFRWFAVPCLAPPCSWAVPLLQEGAMPDPAGPSLLYRNDTGTYLLRQSDDPSASCSRGWRYAAEGTEVEVCSETCDLIQSTYGDLEILLGCFAFMPPY